MTLKERMTELRSKYETVLPSREYIMAMIDGKNFSRKIKNKFKKPFDRAFIAMMNETAVHVLKEMQYGCFAYVQSDEITFVFHDAVNDGARSFFGNRLSKLSSLIPSSAAAKFNMLMAANALEEYTSSNDDCSAEAFKNVIGNIGTYCFDCKVWTCGNYNDVASYLLWRQNDCIRNSKQQAAQTYLPHKSLLNKDSNEQVKMLMYEKGIDWNTEYDGGMKYGRFIYKEKENFISEKYGEYDRSVWKAHDGFPLSDESGRERLQRLDVIPII